MGYRAGAWAFSHHTMAILRKANLLYDSSLMAMDSPYVVMANGEDTGLMELPVSWILDDAPYFSRAGALPSPEAIFKVYQDEFDKAYQEGGMLMATFHPHIVGRRSRMVHLEKLITYMKSKPGVWFATAEQIANHVKPPPGRAVSSNRTSPTCIGAGTPARSRSTRWPPRPSDEIPGREGVYAMRLVWSGDRRATATGVAGWLVAAVPSRWRRPAAGQGGANIGGVVTDETRRGTARGDHHPGQHEQRREPGARDRPGGQLPGGEPAARPLHHHGRVDRLCAEQAQPSRCWSAPTPPSTSRSPSRRSPRT